MSEKRLKELHDYPWFPNCWREFMTDFLAFFATHFFQYNPIFPVISKVLKRSGIRKIKDTCSGGSAYLLRLSRFLAGKHDRDIKIELTDKYPNLKAFNRIAELSRGTISYSENSVDAMNINSHNREFRVMFSAMHHFSKEELRDMIRRAIDDDCAIGFFDYATRNHLRTLLLMPGLIPMIWCVTPFLRPFSWTRLLWTYILPAVPIVLFIDGLISRCNGYRSKDLKGVVGDFSKDGWRCECGTVTNFFMTGEVVYLVCYREENTEE